MAGAQMVPVFLTAALLAAVGNAGRVVEPALVADVVPAPLLDGRMALFGATGWAGAVLGLAGTGYAVQWIGLRPALLVAATIPLMAVLLLGAARYRRARSHHELVQHPLATADRDHSENMATGTIGLARCWCIIIMNVLTVGLKSLPRITSTTHSSSGPGECAPWVKK